MAPRRHGSTLLDGSTTFQPQPPPHQQQQQQQHQQHQQLFQMVETSDLIMQQHLQMINNSNSNNSGGNNTSAGFQQCCTPAGECLRSDSLIRPSVLHECVKVVCNNEACPAGQFMHRECFEAWELTLLAYLKTCGRARSWSERQRHQNLWSKKGYDLAFKACGCKCGRGHLKKDLDWIPPGQRSNSNSSNHSSAADAASELQSSMQQLMNGASVTNNNASEVKKKKRRNRQNNANNNAAGNANNARASLASLTAAGSLVNGSASNNGSSSSNNNSSSMLQRNGSSDGSQIIEAQHQQHHQQHQQQQHHQNNGRGRAGSWSSSTGSCSPLATSETSVSPLHQPQAIAKRKSKVDFFSDRIRQSCGANGIFSRRLDFSAFNSLPRTKLNSYHIKMEDEGNHGNDDTRCFILSTLAALQWSRVSCVLCRGAMLVFDRYPLVDGTFFLSPRQHSTACAQVKVEGRTQFLSAVCMSCLEGSGGSPVRCRSCTQPWDGSSLVLGTMYSYDIFAAMPCCTERLKCNSCHKPLIYPHQRLNFYSDYSRVFACPTCRAVDAHFVKPLSSCFTREHFQLYSPWP